jgi:hypothetical protein
MKKSTIGKGLLLFGGLGLASGASGIGAPTDSSNTGGLEDSLATDNVIVAPADSLPQGPILPEGIKFMDENKDLINDFYQNPDGSIIAHIDSVSAGSTSVKEIVKGETPYIQNSTVQDSVPVGSTSIKEIVSWNPLFSQPDSMTWYFQTEGGEKFPVPTDGLGGNPAGDGMSGQELINYLYQASADSLGVSGPWSSLDDSTQAAVAGRVYEIGEDMGICIDNTYATTDSTRNQTVARRPTSDSLETEKARIRARLEELIDFAKRARSEVEGNLERDISDGDSTGASADTTRSVSGDDDSENEDSKAARYFRAVAAIYSNPGVALDAFIGNESVKVGLGVGILYNPIDNTAMTRDSSSVRYLNPLGFSERGSVIDRETSLKRLAFSFPRVSVDIKGVTLTGSLDHYQAQTDESGFNFVRNVVDGIQEDYDDESRPSTQIVKWDSSWGVEAGINLGKNWGISAGYKDFNKQGNFGISYRFGDGRNQKGGQK